jgi:hypothetical protein
MTTLTKLDNLDKLDIFEYFMDQEYSEFKDYFYNEYYDNYYDEDEDQNKDDDDKFTTSMKIDITTKWIKDTFNNNLMKLNSYLLNYDYTLF